VNGLNQIRDAVIQTLKNAGLAAIPAWEGTAKRYARPVVAVDVAQAAGGAMALGSYLGEVYDKAAGTVRELYGRRLEVCISLEVRAPAASGCESAMESAAETLMRALPSGLRPGEQEWKGLSWDAGSQMFLRTGSLQCRAYFTASSEAGDGDLLDFILKGVVKQ
jgi:hypothetical protein